MRHSYEINKDWQFKIEDNACGSVPNKEKLTVWNKATVPGTVHTDLLNLELIPDPFYADNENQLGWIAEKNWVYMTNFDIPADFRDDLPVWLEFDGIDTIAEITINGETAGTTENMFRRYVFDVTPHLKKYKNELIIRFISPLKYTREFIDTHGELFSARHPERVYIRKAQYSFGWDWGPAFPTVGIWRPVRLLQKGPVNIHHVRFDTLSIMDKNAKVQIGVEVEGDYSTISSVTVRLSGTGQNVEKTVQANEAIHGVIELDIHDAQLWWPNGSGPQYLYRLQVELRDEKNSISDKSDQKVGIRTVQLVTENDGKKCFTFVVNDVPVFMKGANWIPADSFLPRVTDKIYQDLLTAAQAAHMNMIRVWGGGIYEQDIFYQLCDELGLMVWQDFMFACAAYPDTEIFRENVTEELVQNIQHLQNHPALAIWCGNNENEWIWHRQNMGSMSNMPGFDLYHKMIPEIVAEFDPYRPYWPTSPFGEEEDPNDERSGNRHQWDVWSRWIDYTDVITDKSNFVTEFGFQGPANLQTWIKTLDKKDLSPQSELFEFHNKQEEGNDRLFRFLAAHLPVKTDFHDFIYLTQLNQGLALRTCLEYWRMRWPETAGSIIWQLNDCWPVCSWSLIDSELLPKMSYHFVRRSLEPILLSVQVNDAGEDEIMILNESAAIRDARLEIHGFDLSGEATGMDSIEKIDLKSGKIIPGKIPCADGDNLKIITLYNDKHQALCRTHFTRKRWKHHDLENANYEYEINADHIRITAVNLILFADIDLPGVVFADRGITLLPGESRNIKFEILAENKLAPESLKVYTLNDYKNGMNK